MRSCSGALEVPHFSGHHQAGSLCPSVSPLRYPAGLRFRFPVSPDWIIFYMLRVTGNPLKGVPEAIESCRALTYVNLQDTLIYSLPLELSRLPLLTNVGLTHQNLKPKLAGAYVSGTRRLMEYLARKDEKRALRDQLRQRLRSDVSRGAVCVCVYVCMCVCMYVCMCACMCVYACVCVYVCICVCVYVWMCGCANVQMCKCAVCARARACCCPILGPL